MFHFQGWLKPLNVDEYDLSSSIASFNKTYIVLDRELWVDFSLKNNKENTQQDGRKCNVWINHLGHKITDILAKHLLWRGDI